METFDELYKMVLEKVKGRGKKKVSKVRLSVNLKQKLNMMYGPVLTLVVMFRNV